jgi:hypothetical protein
VKHLSGAPSLTHKHWTRLNRLARDKPSSLLRKSVNYGRKKFYDTGPSFSYNGSFTFAKFVSESLPYYLSTFVVEVSYERKGRIVVRLG